MNNKHSFLVTKEYKRFVEFCDACRRYKYIGICYGPPGFGKTVSARHYAKWDFLGPLLKYSSNDQLKTSNEVLNCHTIFYTAPTIKASRMNSEISISGIQLNTLIDRAKEEQDLPVEEYEYTDGDHYTDLVIVDEIDRLKVQGLEQLRDFYDQNDIGLVLIGMPGIEKRLARYPQLYSRIGFAHEFKKLSTDEMNFILQYKGKELGLNINLENFTDYEAVATLTRITGGNFRLIQRIFTQIERIMEINNLDTISKEVIETARESLVIGSI